MEAAAVEGRRFGREGNRWVNTIPTAEELADWFEKNVEVDDDLEHSNYVGGVVLIPATEKSKRVTGWEGNAPQIEEFEDLVFTPYIRVETRLKYLHDLCEKKKWIAFIDPAVIEKQDAFMPPGFFKRAVATGENREARYVGCSKKVVIYEAQDFKEEKVLLDKRTGEEGTIRVGTIVRSAPEGTKTVPTVRVWGRGQSATVSADDNAVMKAETGAIGRALGMAGMLVIPGSGIATAEDVQESRSNEAQQPDGPSSEGATLPEESPAAAIVSEPASGKDPDEQMREEITTMLAALESEFPEDAKSFKAWAQEKGYGRLSETVSPQLRGMHRRIITVYDDAVKKREAKKGGGSGAAGDAPPSAE